MYKFSIQQNETFSIYHLDIKLPLTRNTMYFWAPGILILLYCQNKSISEYVKHVDSGHNVGENLTSLFQFSFGMKMYSNHRIGCDRSQFNVVPSIFITFRMKFCCCCNLNLSFLLFLVLQIDEYLSNNTFNVPQLSLTKLYTSCSLVYE